jgi:hypothetical protein
MKNIVTSIYAQVIYMIGMGLGFLLIPNFVLTTLGLEPTSEVLIRVLGALAFAVSGYYFTMARHEIVPFFKISVGGRFLFCGILVVLALLQIGPTVFYLFAAIETGLAIWTLVGLRRANL